MKLGIHFFRYYMCTMFILLSMTSCHWFNQDDKQLYDRTVLVYIAAENTIAWYAQDDINEMLLAVDDIPANSRLIVYVDDTKLPRILSIERSKDRESDYRTLLQHSTEQDSGDPETLHETMEWVIENFPSHSYGLVLWSHGDAWLPAKSPLQRSIDIDNNQNTSSSDTGSKMDIADVAEVLSTFPKLDFMLFDACFMQSIEVAYELRHVTKAIIASPAEIPGPGAPYHRIVKPMFASPFDASKIAEGYYQEYSDENRKGEAKHHGVLISTIECEHLDEFAATTAEMITRYTPKANSLALGDIAHYCYKPSESRPSYYDMNGYMRCLITEEADYNHWKSALDKTVVYAAATPWWYSIYSGKEYVDSKTYSGLSCYVPQPTNTKLNTKFRITSWYQAAGWKQVGW